MGSFARFAPLAALIALVACHDGPTKPKTGTFVVAIDGIPVDVLPFTHPPVTVTGPNGFQATISLSSIFENMPPGTYTLTADTVRTATTSFGAPPSSRQIEVVGGGHDSLLVHYAPVTGSLFVSLGLSTGVIPKFRIEGPNGFDLSITSSQLVANLEPGTYTLTCDTVSANGYLYASDQIKRTVTIVASATTTRVSFVLLPITGSLAVSFSGLPAFTPASAQITGPDGFARTLTASTTLTGLHQGSYTITTPDVSASGLAWRAGTGSATVPVNLGATAAAPLEFVPIAGDGSILANLRVDGFTLTQVVQRDDNSIPMVSGRGAILRIRVLSSTPNSSRPPVRVRYFANGAIADSATIPAPDASVPTAPSVDPLVGTWDIRVPASLVRPGLGIQVEVDPDRQLSQATTSDDVFPAAGARAIDVRTGYVPVVRLVPILQSLNGRVGDVTTHSPDEYLAFLKRIYPVGGAIADLRLPYTTFAPELDAHDTTGAWERILSELEAVRVANHNDLPFYYGIVNVTYSAGIAGLGYVSGRSAIGWDHWEPTYVSTPAMILAHEIGHNFGRLHSPGCGATGVDPAYPYANGSIGVPGWDSLSGSLIAPSAPDLMSYCHPEWISDYTYTKVFDVLSTLPPTLTVASAGAIEPCLLVWGRIHDGIPVLEPAFEIDARPTLPARPGAHALRLVDDRGAALLDLSFQAQPIADLPSSSSFAFAIPISRLGSRTVSELRLLAAGREVRVAAPPPISGVSIPDPELRLSRGAANRLAVRWNANRFPMVMVRDQRTGEVLSFARGGDASVWSQRNDVELIFSDRVRSVSRRMSVR